VPRITGRPVAGGTLKLAHGTWFPTPTGYVIRWQRCAAGGSGCVAIVGATGTAYAPGAADLGHSLRVVEQASDQGGLGPAIRSAPTHAVTLSTPALTEAVLAGVARCRPALTVQASARGRPASFRSLTLVLPAGLRFTALRWRGVSGLTVTSGRRTVPIARAQVAGTRLTLTLARSVSAIRIAIGTSRLTVSSALAHEIAHHRAPRLMLALLTPLPGANGVRVSAPLRLH
jgi:hypothetical protein